MCWSPLLNWHWGFKKNPERYNGTDGVDCSLAFILAVECLWLGWRRMDVAVGFLLGTVLASKTTKLIKLHRNEPEVLKLEKMLINKEKEKSFK